jgi:hypothetical protein
LVARWLLAVCVTLAMLLAPAAVLAQAPATPAASLPPVIGSGDSRSEGEGPGFVGSPVAIAVGVVVLGVVTAVVTVLVMRAGGARREG